MKRFLLYLQIFFILMTLTMCCHAKTILFSNFVWQVREGTGNPGSNYWSDQNVWLDEKGWLHLKINYQNNRWHCASLYTDTRLGFGSYWFFINGHLDKLDSNAVLALFNYPVADIGKDQTNEIDIELTKWGSNEKDSFNTSYTVWPSDPSIVRTQLFSHLKQNNEKITHGFIWDSKKILFLSGNGEDINYNQLLASWKFSPPDYLKRIPQNAMPIYIDFYLLKGAASSKKKDMEIIIQKFCFQSIDGKQDNCKIKNKI